MQLTCSRGYSRLALPQLLVTQSNVVINNEIYESRKTYVGMTGVSMTVTRRAFISCQPDGKAWLLYRVEWCSEKVVDVIYNRREQFNRHSQGKQVQKSSQKGKWKQSQKSNHISIWKMNVLRVVNDDIYNTSSGNFAVNWEHRWCRLEKWNDQNFIRNCLWNEWTRSNFALLLSEASVLFIQMRCKSTMTDRA